MCDCTSFLHRNEILNELQSKGAFIQDFKILHKESSTVETLVVFVNVQIESVEKFKSCLDEDRYEIVVPTRGKNRNI